MFCSVPVQTKLYEDDVYVELLLQRQVLFCLSKQIQNIETQQKLKEEETDD